MLLGRGESADTFYLLLGHNDFNDVPDWEPRDYETNMRAIVDLIELHSGSRDVRIISSPYAWDVPGYDRSANRERADIQRDIDVLICATDARVSCAADLRPALLFPRDYTYDGVHLNQAGHLRVADLLIPEPATARLLGLAVAMLGMRRRSMRGRRPPL